MTEVRLLRIAVAVTCMVPIIAGGIGVLLGPGMFAINAATGAADSHYRYLSGLLFCFGRLFHVSRHRPRAFACSPSSSSSAGFALGMELGVTPTFLMWQARVAARRRRAERTPRQAGW